MAHNHAPHTERLLAAAAAAVAVTLALLFGGGWPADASLDATASGRVARAAQADDPPTATPTATPYADRLAFTPRWTTLVPGWSPAVAVLTVWIDPYVGTGSSSTLYPLSFDGDLNTPSKDTPGYTGFDFFDNDKWLYIGSAVPFTHVQAWAEILPGGYGGGLWGVTNPNGPAAQYFNGRNWVGLTIDSDTTIVNGNSFAQAGEITFSLNGGSMGATSEMGRPYTYYIRGRFNAKADRIHIPELHVYRAIGE